MPADTRGFTIIELLVVMVIISVLAAIAIPQFFQTKERAYVGTMRHDLKNLSTAQEAYFVDHQQYSGTISGLTLGLKVSANVTLSIDSATASGWGATATHAYTSRECEIAVSQGAKGTPTCP